MPERIEVPPTLSGDTRTQIMQLWRYIYGMSETMNRNLAAVGGNELTDRERAAMHGISSRTAQYTGQNETESLKDMVVKTAEYVQQAIGEIQKSGLAEDVASGRFARYVNDTGVQVQTNPTGSTRDSTLAAALMKMSADAIRNRNYVYTGILRTEGVNDIYGTAIGKDVVTFAQDGTETYHSENAVLEITDGKIRMTDNGEELLRILSDVVNSEQILRIRPGLDADRMIIEGDVEGNLTGDVTGDVTGNLTGTVLAAETTETDLDNITDEGHYWLDYSGMTNGPADLITGTWLTEILGTTGILYQRISTEDAIYSRQKTGSSWSSWVKYAGI